MKNTYKFQVFLLIVFCLISNVVFCSELSNRDRAGEIFLDKEKKKNLLAYMLKNSIGYWPEGATIKLESFRKVGNEYEAIFAGRWKNITMIPLTNGVSCNMCRKRTGFILKEVLQQHNINLPE